MLKANEVTRDVLAKVAIAVIFLDIDILEKVMKINWLDKIDTEKKSHDFKEILYADTYYLHALMCLPRMYVSGEQDRRKVLESIRKRVLNLQTRKIYANSIDVTKIEKKDIAEATNQVAWQALKDFLFDFANNGDLTREEFEKELKAGNIIGGLDMKIFS